MKEKFGSPELIERMQALTDELQKGGYSALIVISDNEADSHVKTVIADRVTNGEGNPLLPDIALINAMCGDDPSAHLVKALVLESALIYLKNHLFEIPKFAQFLKEVAEEAYNVVQTTVNQGDEEIPIMLTTNGKLGEC